MTLSKSAIKAILRDKGLAPKKWLGQNLLIDPYYLRRIVDAASVAPGEAVVEIGAGLGALTEALAEKEAQVLALEVDSGFFRVLEERCSGFSNVELVHADAMKFDFQSHAERFGKLRVIANLPYSISSRLIFRFLESRRLFSSLSVLLQREVAERLIAEPGTKDYGVLTALLGVCAITEQVFEVPPKAFYPEPEIVSSLIRISFPDPAPLPLRNYGFLQKLVKASFASRRKTLRNNLKSLRLPGLDEQRIFRCAEDAGIELSRRAESLSPEEFARFADRLSDA